MKKLSLFILLCCMSIAGYCSSKYCVTTAGTPSGTASYCWSEITSSGYTSNWGGCAATSGTVNSISYQWIMDGTAITGVTGASGTFTMSATVTSGSVSLSAGALTTLLSSYGTGTTHTLTIKYSWGGAVMPCTSLSSLTSSGLSITIHNLPSVSVSPSSGTYCYGPSGISLSASGAVSYAWSPADGSLSMLTGASVTATPAVSTTYIVTGTDANGCTATASSNITIAPLFATSAFASPASICNGGTATLTTNITNGAYTADAVSSIGYAPVATSEATTIFTNHDSTINDLYNDAWENVPLPFTFNFFGMGFSSVNINANGFVNFGPVGPDYTYYTGSTLPDNADGLPPYVIALFMHDLDPDLGGSITYKTTGTAPNRSFVISYTNIPDNDGFSANNTGQIVLYEGTNNIDLLISNCTETGGDYTTCGIQNMDGSYGVGITGENGDQFTITTPQAWRFSGTVPSGGGYSYSWTMGATTADATVTPGATTTYTVTTTDVSSGCVETAVATLIVTAAPTVTSITPGVSSICSGGSVALTTTTSGGSGTPTYTWSGAGIATTTTSVPTITVSPTVSGTFSVTVAYDGSGCGTSAAVASSTVAVTMATGQQWQGNTNTDWNTASNWSCGAVPIVTDDAEILSTATIMPILVSSVTGVVHSLDIKPGATITMNAGAQLNVHGDFTNNGQLISTGAHHAAKLSLVGSSLQTLYGSSSLVSSIELNNAAGATINNTGTDTLVVMDTLLLTNGLLTTNGRLIIYSDSLVTGHVGTITNGSLSNDTVIVEQFVPGHRRAFRFVGTPYSSPVPLSQFEQYIDITGTGGTANGFTTTGSNAQSTFWYNPLIGNSAIGGDPGWVAFLNTWGSPSANMVKQYEGIRLFMRGGPKGTGIFGTPYDTTSVIYRTHGILNTGNQNITLSRGTASVSGTPVQQYNLICNPYASPVDIGTVLYNAKHATPSSIYGTAYYVWNPYGGAPGYSGTFITVPIDGTPYYLGANLSFEVEAAANGVQLYFTENNKWSGNTTNQLMKTAPEYTTLSVYDNAANLYDQLRLKFDDGATDNKDCDYDAGKPPSPAALEFYSRSADQARLAIDVRPYKENSVIPLGLTSKENRDYIIRADQVADAVSGQLYLHDKWQNHYTLMEAGAQYQFSVTDDVLSQGENRFELSMQVDGVTPVSMNGLNAQLLPNPATDEVTVKYSNAVTEQTSITIANVTGQTVISRELGMQQSGSVVIPVNNLASGVYMVTFTSGNSKVVKRLVKE